MVEMLARASPFDGLDLAMPPLIVVAQPVRSRYIVHGEVDMWETSLGLPLPRVACRSASRHGTHALWLGPDEWLLLADKPLTMRGLIDISHRQVALRLSGPHAASALNMGCPLDLDPGVLPVGACTRTLFGKADIVLWRVAAQTFHIEVARSFAPYVVALLREASRGLT
jgi:sarcosine oxidase subunit gamma